MPYIKVTVYTYIAFIAFCLCYDLQAVAAVILSVAVHEAGHIIFILSSGDSIREITVSPFGLILMRNGSTTSHKRSLAIYLAGPIFSFLLSALCCISGDIYTAQISLFYGIINLLPISVFDGGKALSEILQIHRVKCSDTILKIISGTLIFILWSAAVFVMLKAGNFVSLFFICLYLFFALFL